MYDFVRDGVSYITSASKCPPSNPSAEGTCDDGDGWPEGFGMVERSGMGEEQGRTPGPKDATGRVSQC
jgi:hypothetical protein